MTLIIRSLNAGKKYCFLFFTQAKQFKGLHQAGKSPCNNQNLGASIHVLRFSSGRKPVCNYTQPITSCSILSLTLQAVLREKNLLQVPHQVHLCAESIIFQFKKVSSHKNMPISQTEGYFENPQNHFLEEPMLVLLALK